MNIVRNRFNYIYLKSNIGLNEFIFVTPKWCQSKATMATLNISRDQGFSPSIPCFCIEYGFISQSYRLKKELPYQGPEAKSAVHQTLHIKLFWGEAMPMHHGVLLKSAFRLPWQRCIVLKETVGLKTK